MDCIIEWEEKQELGIFSDDIIKELKKEKPDYHVDFVEVEKNSIDKCYRIHILRDEYPRLEFSLWKTR